MTPRQREVYDYLIRYRSIHGYSPTYIEIAQALGFASPGNAREVMLRLIKQGRVRTNATARAQRVLIPLDETGRRVV
jgi:repressor LexA